MVLTCLMAALHRGPARLSRGGTTNLKMCCLRTAKGDCSFPLLRRKQAQEQVYCKTDSQILDKLQQGDKRHLYHENIWWITVFFPFLKEQSQVLLKMVALWSGIKALSSSDHLPGSSLTLSSPLQPRSLLWPNIWLVTGSYDLCSTVLLRLTIDQASKGEFKKQYGFQQQKE